MRCQVQGDHSSSSAKHAQRLVISCPCVVFGQEGHMLDLQCACVAAKPQLSTDQACVCCGKGFPCFWPAADLKSQATGQCTALSTSVLFLSKHANFCIEKVVTSASVMADWDWSIRGAASLSLLQPAWHTSHALLHQSTGFIMTVFWLVNGLCRTLWSRSHELLN